MGTEGSSALPITVPRRVLLSAVCCSLSPFSTHWRGLRCASKEGAKGELSDSPNEVSYEAHVSCPQCLG